jgi:hypothetical protein
MKRPDETGLGLPGVERVGGDERVRIDHDDRVERRPLLVVRLDAVEIHLHELPAGDLARFERGVDVGDGRFLGCRKLEACRVRGEA